MVLNAHIFLNSLAPIMIDLLLKCISVTLENVAFVHLIELCAPTCISVFEVGGPDAVVKAACLKS